ncbi:H(+)-transporting V1 sector ATPase subunit F, partial [Ascosphaera atra]
SVTGLLLAGIGHVTEPPDSERNFLVVDSKTETSTIEKAFDDFTQRRKDIGILLINQHVRPFAKGLFWWIPSPEVTSVLTFYGCYQIAERIREKLDAFTEAFPAVLEIPSKDHPYDPDKDSVLRRVRRLFGE